MQITQHIKSCSYIKLGPPVELQAKSEKKAHDRNIILELQAQKLRLKRIMTYKTKGVILRSKVKWHEQGERNTKYFYGLEKRILTIKQ